MNKQERMESLMSIADQYTGEEREMVIELLEATVEIIDGLLIKLEDK